MTKHSTIIKIVGTRMKMDTKINGEKKVEINPCIYDQSTYTKEPRTYNTISSVVLGKLNSHTQKNET